MFGIMSTQAVKSEESEAVCKWREDHDNLCAYLCIRKCLTNALPFPEYLSISDVEQSAKR